MLAPIDEDEADVDLEATNHWSRGIRVTPGPRKNLSDFEQVRKLGSGNFGDAYLCRDKTTKSEYAMKKLYKGNYHKPGGRLEQRMHRQERDTLRLCGVHENVASLCYAFEADSCFVLITEFCDLGNLSAYARSNGKPGFMPDVARDCGMQILHGLGHMHRHWILHRDVKPENIALKSSSGRPVLKLIDFGLAKRANNRQSATIVGSYGYLAPELVGAMQIVGGPFRQGTTTYDGRVDIYSFGVTLFFLFVGLEAEHPENRTVWTHDQVQRMLVNEHNLLWKCAPYIRNYDKHNTSAREILSRMRECRAVTAVQALTKTEPSERTETVGKAFELSFFGVPGTSSASQSSESLS
jgi:serine/threonine protein kinase